MHSCFSQSVDGGHANPNRIDLKTEPRRPAQALGSHQRRRNSSGNGTDSNGPKVAGKKQGSQWFVSTRLQLPGEFRTAKSLQPQILVEFSSMGLIRLLVPPLRLLLSLLTEECYGDGTAPTGRTTSGGDSKKLDKSQNSGRDSSTGSEVVSATGSSCLPSNVEVSILARQFKPA